MQETEQTKGQTILQHGESVWEYAYRIINGDHEGMMIPEWIDDILPNILPIDTIKEYLIMHDCGKPYCIEFDSDGKVHFPNHAEQSEKVYRSIPNHDPIAAELIGLDMIMHVETADQITNRNLSTEYLCTLALAALAEVHSNASMFGGIESTSFKIKWKKINKRGKMISKTLKSMV